MFYAQATCTALFPDAAAVDDALAKGFRVAVFADANDADPGPLRDDPRITLLRPYPATRDARRLAERLLALPSHRLALYNARDGDLLADYLESFGMSVRVESHLPGSASEWQRNQQEGRTPVVLLQPGAEAPGNASSQANAVFVVDPKYALPLR